MDECIDLNQEALRLLPEHHPFRTVSLSNLANGLTARFKQHGRPEDLD